MLGHKLCRELLVKHEVHTTLRGIDDACRNNPSLVGFSRANVRLGVNALDLQGVTEVIDDAKPQAVINCIGIVKQREAAKAAIPSILINALFPHQLAEICQKRNVRVIHVSTDCVFSGNRGSYTEDDIPDPPDLYGRTKLLGEIDGPGCLTLRTSIIGWELTQRAGLLEWFAAQRGRSIKGYRGAIYTGVSTTVLADLITTLLEKHPDLSGLYQVASKPINKYDLLVRLRDALGWKDIVISPDDDFRCDRSLAGGCFEAATGWHAPAWDDMIAGLAKEWAEYEHWR